MFYLERNRFELLRFVPENARTSFGRIVDFPGELDCCDSRRKAGLLERKKVGEGKEVVSRLGEDTEGDFFFF